MFGINTASRVPQVDEAARATIAHLRTNYGLQQRTGSLAKSATAFSASISALSGRSSCLGRPARRARAQSGQCPFPSVSLHQQSATPRFAAWTIRASRIYARLGGQKATLNSALECVCVEDLMQLIKPSQQARECAGVSCRRLPTPASLISATAGAPWRRRSRCGR